MTSMTPASMAPQTIHLETSDEVALEYLGAAAVLQWHSFPEAMRQSLLQ